MVSLPGRLSGGLVRLAGVYDLPEAWVNVWDVRIETQMPSSLQISTSFVAACIIKGMRCSSSPLVYEHDLNMKLLQLAPSWYILGSWSVRALQSRLFTLNPAKGLNSGTCLIAWNGVMNIFKTTACRKFVHHLVAWQSPSLQQLRTRTILCECF